MSLLLAFEGNIVPLGVKKSSSGSPFHVPKRPFVSFLKLLGAANTIESAPDTTCTVTDIPDGKTIKKELFPGLATATEPFSVTDSFVRLVQLKAFPSINTLNPVNKINTSKFLFEF